MAASKPHTAFSPQHLVIPIDQALDMADDNPVVAEWLAWRRHVKDPGPVHLVTTAGEPQGLCYTERSEREDDDVSMMIIENAALADEVGAAIEGALDRFAIEHATLLARVLDRIAPEKELDLASMTTCAFLGHTLERLRRSRGPAHAETVVGVVLGELEAIAEAKSRAPTERLS